MTQVSRRNVLKTGALCMLGAGVGFMPSKTAGVSLTPSLPPPERRVDENWIVEVNVIPWMTLDAADPDRHGCLHTLMITAHWGPTSPVIHIEDGEEPNSLRCRCNGDLLKKHVVCLRSIRTWLSREEIIRAVTKEAPRYSLGNWHELEEEVVRAIRTAEDLQTGL